MLLNELQSQGLSLSVSHDKLVFKSGHELLSEEIKFLKDNKKQLMLEVVNAPEIEVIEGIYFPLHRLKSDDHLKPVASDLIWIDEQLRTVDNRLFVAAEYSRIYQRAFEQEPKGHRKDGVARCAANSWLRDHCEILVKDTACQMIITEEA